MLAGALNGPIPIDIPNKRVVSTPPPTGGSVKCASVVLTLEGNVRLTCLVKGGGVQYFNIKKHDHIGPNEVISYLQPWILMKHTYPNTDYSKNSYVRIEWGPDKALLQFEITTK